MEKKTYKFITPALIDGVKKDSVEYRELTVADLVKVNKAKESAHLFRMIAYACGIAPPDVENFKSRDLLALKTLIVDSVPDEVVNEEFETDAAEVITVDLLHPITTDEGEEIKQITLEEPIAAQVIRTEKMANGNDFTLVYMRMIQSSGLSAANLGKIKYVDYMRMSSALSVFFTPTEET